ncbi:hypothetical protein QWY86_17840 [Pedobacter aquatilis]|uniref:hypothetical protein n=1 Tax=Pedobacter aquatilis TaxID=351343 RepID=UPI0025B53DA1|nr:hypothetical protein [Pedobacter aquatilis]MDN3588548.1 hypothetical protein [Pedobacter aquatilis]
MEKRKSELTSFLQKVKQLRGFGDMNSYKVVSEFKQIAGDDYEEKLRNIIEDFSKPHTYQNGKSSLIKKVESELKK